MCANKVTWMCRYCKILAKSPFRKTESGPHAKHGGILMIKKALQKTKPFLYGVLLFFSLMAAGPVTFAAGPIIIDHTCTDITQIPGTAIEQAKAQLHIAYGHTSHGSQLTTGMTGLVAFANVGGLGLSHPENFFQWNNGGLGGALDLHDSAMAGDCGYYPAWVNNTTDYLNTTINQDVNVIIWSWCGQVDDKYAAGTLESEYLTPMANLEIQYPGVTFVYMTGHVDHWDDANNKAANQMIRDFCIANDKVLYDFADIESYDPDGTFYEFPHDNCDYYASAGGAIIGNWATEWQSSHTQNVDWYSCTSAHSQPLNANQKAYAAWWLWARIAGWNPDGGSVAEYDLTVEITGEGSVTLDPSGTTYDQGTPVQLTALPDGSEGVFTGWSGDLSGLDNPASITMDADKTVTATFIEIGAGSGDLTSRSCVDPDSLPDSPDKPDDFPYGLLEIEMAVVNAGGQGSVTIYLPNVAPEDYKWYKYTSAGEWIDFDRNVVSNGAGDGAEFNIDRTEVTVYITDNGQYDDDPTGMVIRDPSGLGFLTSSNGGDPDSSGSDPGSSGSSSSGGGCFISTVGNLDS